MFATIPDFKPQSQAEFGFSIDPDKELIGDVIAQVEEQQYKLFYKEISKHLKKFLFKNDDPNTSTQNVVIVDVYNDQINTEVYSTSENAEEIGRDLEKHLKVFKIEEKSPDGIWADFSFRGSRSIRRHKQFVKAPAWSDIEQNYPDATKNKLQNILDMEKPWKQGRLLILHGDAGTGKTYFLRSLMMKWSDEFKFLVVTDPEQMVSNPEYYYDVASDRYSFVDDCDVVDDSLLVGKTKKKKKKKKRLLFIMEDSADMVTAASRTVHGDKIGKLLNITDGLFGQGREDLFVITFNEEVSSIDPAFLRPGRCIETVSFDKFSIDEANRWFAERKYNHTADKDLTLAEMYSKILGREAAPKDNIKRKAAVGFGFGSR